MENVTLETAPDRRPLALVVTEAGRESVVLRALVRQALPMLTDPHGYRAEERERLARTLALAVGGGEADEEIPFDPTDADVPPDEEDEEGYEPGCLVEDPWS